MARRRGRLVKQRTASFQRIDALVELFGPAWSEVLGTGDYGKASLAVREHYANPHQLNDDRRQRHLRCGRLL